MSSFEKFTQNKNSSHHHYTQSRKRNAPKPLYTQSRKQNAPKMLAALREHGAVGVDRVAFDPETDVGKLGVVDEAAVGGRGLGVCVCLYGE
jgi:hypothetical protein